MKLIQFFVCIMLISVVMGEAMFSRMRSPYPFYSKQNLGVRSNINDPAPPPYEEYYYVQTLDHFNFYNKGTFLQRYLVSDTYFKQPSGPICESPVLFYTGNEGDIVWFYENSQFVTNVLAQQMGALLLFAEHRFYGETLPFGNDSSLPQNIGYLTSEQALADYAQLVPAVLNDMGISHCPVLAVGGSYGGMLASWARMKYPNVFDGALAASAPILYFLGTDAASESFNEIATNDFAETSSEGTCATRIRNAFNEIVQVSTTPNGLSQLTKTFSLCEELTNLSDLINWLEAAITYMCMADYAYPANFLEPMPGNPVNVSCQLLSEQSDDIQGLVQVTNVYFNSSGQAGQCNNVSVYTTGALGSDGWDYQACTEMVMPISSNGVQDFFPAAPWSLAQLNTYCQQTWQVTPNPYWITTYYQGQDLSQTSNIIFSNGILDPWRGGGVVTKDYEDQSIISIVIEGGAHHSDLRMPNQADSTSLTQARLLETKLLFQFAREASIKKQLKH